MTTDNFTQAARAEAERVAGRRHLGGNSVPTSAQRAAFYQEVRLFEEAAEWARDHLAAQEGHRRVRKYADDWDTCTCGYDAWPCRSQEPTDAEVEAAARAISAEQDRRIVLKAGAWWGGAEYRRDFARKDARAALSAARAVRRDVEKR